MRSYIEYISLYMLHSHVNQKRFGHMYYWHTSLHAIHAYICFINVLHQTLISYTLTPQATRRQPFHLERPWPRGLIQSVCSCRQPCLSSNHVRVPRVNETGYGEGRSETRFCMLGWVDLLVVSGSRGLSILFVGHKLSFLKIVKANKLIINIGASVFLPAESRLAASASRYTLVRHRLLCCSSYLSGCMVHFSPGALSPSVVPVRACDPLHFAA